MTSHTKDLMTISREEMAKALVEVSVSSGRDAGRALEEFAHVRGDLDAAEVIRQTDPMVLAKILQDYDYSSPTIANWLMSPDLLRDLVEVHPYHWEQEVLEDPLTASKHALAFFTYLLGLEDDENRRTDILDALYCSESGVMYLYLALIGLEGQIECSEGNMAEFDVGTEAYLFCLICRSHAGLEEVLSDMLHGLTTVYTDAAWADLAVLTKTVYRNARKKVEQRVTSLDDDETDDDFFQPL